MIQVTNPLDKRCVSVLDFGYARISLASTQGNYTMTEEVQVTPVDTQPTPSTVTLPVSDPGPAPTEAPAAPKDKKAKAPKAPKAPKASKKAKVKKPGAGSLDALEAARKQYKKSKVKTKSGAFSVDCGDTVANRLRGKSLDEIYSETSKHLGVPATELKRKYGHLNEGMQRMNLGNRLRGTKKGK